ncbi:hypothetical protein V4B17_06415 [Bartonella sp. B23]
MRLRNVERLSNFQLQNNDGDNIIVAVVVMFFMITPLYAPKISEDAKEILDALQIEISVIISLAAAVMFFGLVIGCAWRFIR